MTQTERTPPPPPGKRILLYVLVPALSLLGLGGYLHWRTFANVAETQQEQKNFVPQVRTETARKIDAPYVAERLVDIGSHVQAGDLLLRIDAPDLDQHDAVVKAGSRPRSRTPAATGGPSLQAPRSR